MTRFVVDLGDLEISKATEAQISQNIQKTVLASLADLKLDNPFVIGFPYPWPGFIWRRDFDQFKVAEKELSKLVNRR